MSDHERTSRSVRRHLARYGLGVTRLLGTLAPSGDANNALCQERRAGLVEYYTSGEGREYLLPGRVSWAVLTKSGCELEGVPVDRAERPSGASLQYKLAVSWHCLTTGCVRLEVGETESLTGWRPPPNIGFVLTPAPSLSLQRIYCATGEERFIVGRIWKIADELMDTAPLRSFIASGRVGILVLAATKQKCAAIKIALKEAKKDVPLPVHVHLGPSPDVLAEYLEERRTSHDSNGD